VISQTSNDFEYIIIDGGSTDGSVDLIKQFSEKIAYWVSEYDGGIYQAMNKGIRIAQGEYVQFINSGDWLVADDVIEKMLKALPECSIFYGNMLKILPNGKIIRDRCEAGKISMLTFIKGSLNHTPNLIKRSLFEKYGFYDESLKIVSDWKFYLNAVGLHDEPVAYIDLDIAWFDMKGISNINKSLHMKERKTVLKELLPSSVLMDYDAFTDDIQIIQRLKRIKSIWFCIQFLYKFMSRVDKASKYYLHEKIDK
jgi:glycosyltransferase involved in cell wall biosynthesis